MLVSKKWKIGFSVVLSFLLLTLNFQTAFAVTSNKRAKGITPEAQADEIVANMTLEEKIGQMFMPDFRNWNGEGFTVYNDEVGDIVKAYHLGGIILFGPNVVGTEQTIRLVDGLQNAVSGLKSTGKKIPLLISIDQEGGSIVRLATGTNMTGNMALGATDEPKQAYNAGKVIGEELKVLGINVNFAPVLDCNVNPFNPVIGVRSFGGDPKLVADMGNSYINGLHDAGIAATGKHFPGHGDTATDSHLGLPVVTHDFKTVHELDLVPFKEAVDSGVDMIMTAHVVFPAIDDSTVISSKDGKPVNLPATLSHKVLTDLLRDEMGFEGVVTTDALNMAAIADNFGGEQAVIMAIKAGTDIVLMPASVTKASEIGNLDRVFKAVLDAVQNGDIPESRIDESAQRIIALKIKRGIYDPSGNSDDRTVDEKIEDALDVVGSKAHKMIETQASDKAVTLVKNDDNMLPFNLKDNDTVVIISPFNDRNDTMIAGLNEVIEDRNIKDVEIKSYTYNNSNVSSSIKDAVDNADYVILGTYGYNASSITPGANYYTQFPRNLIAYNSGSKNVPLVAMAICAPYDIMSIPDVEAFVAVYGRYANTQNLLSGMRAIFGFINPSGKLPVDIPDGVDGYENNIYLYNVGYGLNYQIAAINISIENTELQRKDTTGISIIGTYKNGMPVELNDADIEYFSSNPNIVDIKDGVIKAKNTGTAEVYVKVTIGGITLESNRVSIKVGKTIGPVREMFDGYVDSGDILGPLVHQLENSLSQAEKFYSEMKDKQAIDHLKDFLKHLNNPAMSAKVSEDAKKALNSAVNAFIEELSIE